MIGTLLAYGLLRFPTVLTTSPTGVRSLIGVLGILVIYVVVGWFGPYLTERINPHILRIGVLGGLLAGFVFASEVLFEYWLLPDDNTMMGVVEYGLVFALFFLVGLWIAYQTRVWRFGILAAVWSAVISILMWS